MKEFLIETLSRDDVLDRLLAERVDGDEGDGEEDGIFARGDKLETDILSFPLAPFLSIELDRLLRVNFSILLLFLFFVVFIGKFKTSNKHTNIIVTS